MIRTQLARPGSFIQPCYGFRLLSTYGIGFPVVVRAQEDGMDQEIWDESWHKITKRERFQIDPNLVLDPSSYVLGGTDLPLVQPQWIVQYATEPDDQIRPCGVRARVIWETAPGGIAPTLFLSPFLDVRSMRTVMVSGYHTGTGTRLIQVSFWTQPVSGLDTSFLNGAASAVNSVTLPAGSAFVAPTMYGDPMAATNSFGILPPWIRLSLAIPSVADGVSRVVVMGAGR